MSLSFFVMCVWSVFKVLLVILRLFVINRIKLLFFSCKVFVNLFLIVVKNLVIGFEIVLFVYFSYVKFLVLYCFVIFVNLLIFFWEYLFVLFLIIIVLIIEVFENILKLIFFIIFVKFCKSILNFVLGLLDL